jgi:hypothetical protein
MNVIACWPRMLSPEMAEDYSGGKKLFDDLIAKELLKPRAQGKGFTRYDRCELDNALDHWRGFDQ